MLPRRRRLTALASAAVVASLVPVLALSSPAHAAGCQDENANAPLGCDDETPPETSPVTVRPAANANGYVATNAVSFDFSGTPNDVTDTGQIGFECQFFNTVTPPTDWTSCASGQSYTGLSQTAATPYTFRVRAVDVPDAANVCPNFLNGCADEADVDPTPSSMTVRVDSSVPNTFVTRAPREEIRPDWPVVLTRNPQLVLNSNEGGAGYQCTVNKKAVPCAGGLVTLKSLGSGDQDFAARAVDAAGNVDPSPGTARFFVPANLKASRGGGWRTVRDGAAFDGDLVQSARPGATLRIGRQRNVREVRLIAPSGPRSGRIQVRVGRSQWYTVDLKGKKGRQTTFVVRDQYSPLQSGAILIRVLSVPRGGSVQLDALVARK